MHSNILPTKARLNQLFHVRREMIWVAAGQMLAFLGAFAGIKILTNVMQPEGYGQLALGMTIAGLVNMFIYGPMGQVVARFFSVCHEKDELRVYFFILKKAHIACGLILLVFICLAAILTNVWAGGKWALLVIMASLFGIVSGINVSFLSLQGAIRQRKVVALHQGIDAWLRPALAIAALYLFSNSVYAVLSGYLLGTILIAISQWVFAMQNEKIRANWHGKRPAKEMEKRSFHEFFAYGYSFAIFAGFGIISMYADRWILQGFFGAREVGIYAAIYQIANAPIALLVGMVNQLMIPIIFERAGTMNSNAQIEASNRLLGQTVIFSLLILLFVTVIAFFIGEQLIQMLTSPSFAGYGQVLWVLVLGLSIFNIAQLMSVRSHTYNRPQVNILPKALQAISFLVLVFFCVKRFDILGIAIALCVSSLFYLIIVYIVNARLKRV